MDLPWGNWWRNVHVWRNGFHIPYRKAQHVHSFLFLANEIEKESFFKKNPKTLPSPAVISSTSVAGINTENPINPGFQATLRQWWRGHCLICYQIPYPSLTWWLAKISKWVKGIGLKLNMHKLEGREKYFEALVTTIMPSAAEGVCPQLSTSVCCFGDLLLLDAQIATAAKNAAWLLGLARRLDPLLSLDDDLSSIILTSMTSRPDYCKLLCLGMNALISNKLQDPKCTSPPC